MNVIPIAYKYCLINNTHMDLKRSLMIDLKIIIEIYLVFYRYNCGEINFAYKL